LKLLKGNDMESVIARSNSLRQLEAVQVPRWCTPRRPWPPRTTEVLCCAACQHQCGLQTEKGERKVGCPFGGDCYSLLLHTLARTVEDETRASARKAGGPGRLGEYVCLQVALPNRLAEVGPISVFGMLTKWLHITRPNPPGSYLREPNGRA
jgi:hypothetical protein